MTFEQLMRVLFLFLLASVSTNVNAQHPFGQNFEPRDCTRLPIISQHIFLEKTDNLQRGDAELGSNNRVRVVVRTDVSLRTQFWIDVNIEYTIEELGGDRTLMTGNSSHVVRPPTGCSIDSILSRDKTALSIETITATHSYMDVSEITKNNSSYFTTLAIKVDGPGDDNQGNVQLTGVLSLPVELSGRLNDPNHVSGEFLAHRFAPVLKLHPVEEYFPMNPLEFIQKSRFRHFKRGIFANDEGWHKYDMEWKKNNDKSHHYYGPPLSILQRYPQWPDGRNRRPKDDNAGPEFQVFLETDSAERGDSNPTGNVPAFYYIRDYKAGPSIETSSAIISYWWFMGFNHAPARIGNGHHQGDWEHVTMNIRDGKLISIWYSAHGKSGEPIPAEMISDYDNRPVVYVADGSHASFHTIGKFPRVLGEDSAQEGGYIWDTSKNLQKLDDQEWRTYAGSWGSIDPLAGFSDLLADFVGPIGPWIKRDKDELDGTNDGVDLVIASVENEHQQESKLSYYPNPVQTSLNIQFETVGRVEIYDSLGRRSHTRQINYPQSLVLDVSRYSPGVYFIKFDNKVSTFIVN